MPQHSTNISMGQIQEARNRNIGRLLLRGTRDFQARSLEKLHERGYGHLTPAHTTVLMHLDVKGTRIITLAERAGMTKQSMGQLVQELEEQGYLTRTPDPSDGRAVLIMFTDAGMNFLQDAYNIKQEIEAEYVSVLGQGDFETLYTLLARLVDTQTHETIE